MTERSAEHVTFTIERRYPTPPARVFAAWSDPEAKRRWWLGRPDEWERGTHELDFRVGGREHLAGGRPGEPAHVYDARYQDIVLGRRIIFSYDMHIGATRISVSLATVELEPAGVGTRLTFTEQAVFLDGYDDAGSREHGTGELLDALGRELNR